MTAEPIVPYAYGVKTRNVGTTRYEPLRGSHDLIDGGVRLNLPVGNKLTDKEAVRLAWAILADLAPDDVIAVPSVVTYREGARLEVLRQIERGVNTVYAISEATGWKCRTVERRLYELREDGRAQVVGGKQMPSGNVAAVWGKAAGEPKSGGGVGPTTAAAPNNEA